MTTQKELIQTSGFGTLERPLYSPGLLLEDEDLTRGVNYTRRLTQLLFSSLFGCGVVCGLGVRAEAECGGRKLKVTVDKGLGLDCFGNPIEVPSPQILTFDPDCDRQFTSAIWVVACYLDKECAPRELSCSYDGGNDRAMTRYKAGFEIKLYGSRPQCACSCEKPEPTPDADRNCSCPPGDAPQSRPDASAPDQANSDGKQRGCYDDHFEGICSCGCGCHCIVIGKILLKPGSDGRTVEKDVGYDTTVVRQIRPMLIGHYKQLNPRPAAPAPTGGGTGGSSSAAS